MITLFMKTFFLLLTLLLLPLPCFAAFSDVTESHTDVDGIIYVQEHGIVQGYADGTFRPDASINRAEFTKIIVGALFAPEGGKCFSDVNDEWFASFVCAAKTKGIIGGYPDGTFKPSQNISFAEAAKIIAAAFGGVPKGEFSVWYEPFVRKLATANAIPVSIGSFDKLVTRGEMAEMIYRLHAKNTDKPSTTFEKLAGLPEVEGDSSVATTSKTQGNAYPQTFAVSEHWAVDWNFFDSPDRSKDWPEEEKKDWNNIFLETSFSHVEILHDEPNIGNALRVNFPKGSGSPFVSIYYNKPTGGVFGTAFGTMKPSEKLHLTYYVRFPENFDFGTEGFLPGLSGGITSSKYRELGSSYFWVEPAWDKQGNFIASGNFYSKTDPKKTTDARFKADNTWHKVEVIVQLNTVPVKRLNGMVEMLLDDQMVFRRDDTHLRSQETDLLEAMNFEATIGSQDARSLAINDMHLDLAGFTVSGN